jgi:OmcA/MtrC family decaheme c-type cytochrome
MHGALRNNTEYCVMCHNPSNTDAAMRSSAKVPADKTAPPQGIHFNLLIHRLHDGVNQPANRPYIVVGYGGSHNDFSKVLFPALTPTGNGADLADCAMCHVNSTEQNNLSLTGLNPVTDPQGPINRSSTSRRPVQDATWTWRQQHTLSQTPMRSARPAMSATVPVRPTRSTRSTRNIRQLS